MKKTFLVAAILFTTIGLMAQSDSSNNKIITITSDTIKVGSISIIKGQGKKDTTVMFLSLIHI
jgi:hypothetical protein